MKVHVYHRTATVEEDIDSQIESLRSLAIEQGAYFEGKSRRDDDPLSGSKSGAPSATSEESDKGKTKARAAE